jgi:hypothetical protein
VNNEEAKSTYPLASKNKYFHRPYFNSPKNPQRASKNRESQSGWGGAILMKILTSIFNVILRQELAKNRDPRESVRIAVPLLPEGQRDFAAAVLLPHAAALAAAVLRQSAAVELTTHVELVGIAVIGGLECVSRYSFVSSTSVPSSCVKESLVRYVKS